jgi:flagellar hook assembly protein FlgD
LNTFALKQNYPNPFNPTTSIEFVLQTSAKISLAIYDLQGALIAEIAHGSYPAGTFSVDWNGANNLGQSVSSGVYLYSLQVGESRVSRQMTYIK